MEIKLTQFSHGSGCGCKLSPELLSELLSSHLAAPQSGLLVGNHTHDDAAVLELDNGQCLNSTTDFFMPIVDDPFLFGKIAATNAISDVYAMGGKPILALGILGFPQDKIPVNMMAEVINGGRQACENAGISMAGGHTIDCQQPFYGLAVNGIVNKAHIKRNNTAKAGHLLYLTKPLGVGILASAAKGNICPEADLEPAIQSMCVLNSFGQIAGPLDYVSAMTDLTGFGLIGHLSEMCQNENLGAEIWAEKLPLIETAKNYAYAFMASNGLNANWKTFGKNVEVRDETIRMFVSDPQTSGGLLIAIEPEFQKEFEAILKQNEIYSNCIGKFVHSNLIKIQ